MQTGHLEIEIKLENGIWKCDCTAAEDKRHTPYYNVMITPPGDYKVTRISPIPTPVTFRYITEMMEFNFGTWPFKEKEFLDDLESELSAVIVKRIMKE